MEARSDQDDIDVKESFLALSTAQAYYLSPKYNSDHFPLDVQHQIMHYLVASAKFVYPKSSKWFAQFYDTFPVPIGKMFYSMFNVKNYPGYVAVCKNYISESIHDAVNAGVKQVVIFNAGFDIHALTKHNQYPTVTFFETDSGLHRDIKLQALKNLQNKQYPTKKIKELAKNIELFGTIHKNLHFIDTNISQDTWLTKMEAYGFDVNKKTLIIAENLSLYLTKEQVSSWLVTLNSVLADSSLILSFQDKANHSVGEKIGEHMMALANEQYKMRIAYSEVPEFMSKCGFDIVEAVPYKNIQKALGLKHSELSSAKNLRDNYFKIESMKLQLLPEIDCSYSPF